MPNSRLTNHETWEHLITGHNYHFAYFDGLNRYYVAGEQIQLRETISIQANVFDDFISSHLDAAWKTTKNVDARLKSVAQEAGERIQKADERAQVAVELSNSLALQLQDTKKQKMQLEVSLNERISFLNTSLAAISDQQQGLLRELSVVYASRSWKITRPLRLLMKKIASLRSSELAQPASAHLASDATLQVASVVTPIHTPEETQISVAQNNNVVTSADLHSMPMSARKTLSDLISRSITKN